MKKKFCYQYPRPAVTVDVVIVTREVKPRVLLIRRKHDPFLGQWAIPGGFVDMDEVAGGGGPPRVAGRDRRPHPQAGATRHLRRPRPRSAGRTISVVYLAQVDADKLHPEANDDAAAVGWFPLARPPADLAFDHAQILAAARQRLREK